MHLILIHGMGRTPVAMLPLIWRLKTAGYTVHPFFYSPTFEKIGGVSERLYQLIQRKIGAQPYAIVGHSLGTVITRYTYPRLSQHPPAACFFIAPPMKVCRMAEIMAPRTLFHWFTGEMGQLLANENFMSQLPIPPQTKIYVGTAGPRAKWYPLGHEENDCVLTVSEATAGLEGRPILRVASPHTFIMNSAQVFEDMVQSLKNRMNSD